MRVKDLIKITNMNINFIYVDRLTNTVIDYYNFDRKELEKFRNRKIYMIFPTDAKDLLKVSLYWGELWKIVLSYLILDDILYLKIY